MQLHCVSDGPEDEGRQSRYATMLHCPNCSKVATELAQLQLEHAAALERIAALAGDRDKAVMRLLDCLKELLTT